MRRSQNTDNEIERLRTQIDAIDTAIVPLLVLRIGITQRIGERKASTGRQVRQHARAQQVLRAARHATPDAACADFVEAVFREIINQSEEAQRRYITGA